jgi:LPS export ABC transporter protein LptC
MRLSLLSAAAFCALSACSDTRGAAVRKGAVTFADSADQVFFNVQAPFETDGVKRGTLFADTLYVLNETTRFDFKVGHVDFNTETGTPNGSMKADRGRYDQRTQILEGWGNVVVKMVDGRSLKTPHVVYNQRLNEVSSDTTFELVDAGKTNTGIGFVGTPPNFAHYQCKRECHVRGAVAIPK